MKKRTAVFLTVVFVLLTAACGAQPAKGVSKVNGRKENADTLVVCVDSRQFMDITDFSSRVYSDTDYDCEKVVFEVLPDADAEREAACDRIRIELMSGGGPDVFILGSTDLFSNVEKIMRGGHFLPLDTYMESWETDLFEKQEKVIMDAGRTEEGQLVLPLLYTLPVFVVEQNEGIDNAVDLRDWEALAALKVQNATVELILREQKTLWFPSRFALLGDYDAEKVTLTQEELRTALTQFEALDVQGTAYAEDVAYAVPGGIISIDEEETQRRVLNGGLPLPEGMRHLAVYEDRSALAVYNTQGGLTATVMAYAAVNRNTQHPEDAVKAAAVLYQDYFQDQQKAHFLASAFGINAVTTSEAYTYYAQVKPYVEQVNAVRFDSEMEEVLRGIVLQVDHDAETLAEDELGRMKMMMAE